MARVKIITMTEKKITSKNVDDKQLQGLYYEAFPEEEQVPWKDLMRLTCEMPLDFTAYYDGDAFVGFTIVYPYKDYNWFWYFAVQREQRGKGYGQQILTHIITKYDDRKIILDMEAPDQIDAKNKKQRLRRLDFYSRNGFHDTHAHRTYDGIEYTIMLHGEGTFTSNDYDAIIKEMMRFWTPEEDWQ